MQTSPAKRQVDSVRSFNRFYTRHIGVLEERLLESPFTLTQARVLFELAQRKAATAGEIGRELGLDAGYLSRIVRDFVTRRLVTRTKSREDSRRAVLTLTDSGKAAFKTLDRNSHESTSSMLSKLSQSDRQRLLGSIGEVQRTLASSDTTGEGEVVLRTHRPGDIGWAIERHGQLYADEFKWNGEFEALVATLFAKFATRHDPKNERLWIAELNGQRVGCVFLVRNENDPKVAQLRCLLVDPKGRGRGVGRRLVRECIAFAKSRHYKKMKLWTNDILIGARRIYEAEGFSLESEERHRSFGHNLVGQVWTRTL